ncbi:MAG: glutamate racemase [Clostridia bacterium]|nr:glutamate racemase [Clostridia bacterium]
MKNCEKPIGFFDSGVGGISVLRDSVNLMPNENFIYFGDSKNAPYGTKSVGEVRDLAVANAEMLVSLGVKAIVIACNSATSAAAELLRQKYPDLPVIGVEPAIKPAVLYKEGGSVLVMATDMTLGENKFKALLDKYKGMCNIELLPCPGLMEWVEKGILEGEEVEKFVDGLLSDYKGRIDRIVLGCTHYPFLSKTIKKVMGEEVVLFDGGEGTARELLRRLKGMNIENTGKNKGEIKFLNSKNEDEIELSKRLFSC